MFTRAKTRNNLIKLVGVLVIGGLVGINVAEDGGRARDRDYNQDRKSRRKLAREGTSMVNQLGIFKGQGDQVTFTYTEDGEERSLKVLQNLALERVADELLNAPKADPPQWSTSGTLTEFRGTNYLLLRRTVMKIRK